MTSDATERRVHSREGLFGQIEDATYRVLRRMEDSAPAADFDELAECTSQVQHRLST